MKNKKSTYYKMFRYSFIVVIVSIILICVFFTAFSSRLFKNDKFNDVSVASEMFISSVKSSYSSNGNMNSSAVMQLHETVMKKYDMSIYVYNSDGKCVIAPYDSGETTLSDTMKNKIDDETYLDFDANDVSSKEPSILYGERFTVQYGGMERERYYLMAYSSSESINEFIAKVIMFQTLIGSLLIILSHYLLKKQAAKYYASAEEFLRVSEKFSKGDFTERINITTEGSLKDISTYVNALADHMANKEDTSKTFIANVSHELRTPMTTIGGFVDGILDGTIPKSNQREYLNLVSKEIKRLKILISSMLNMTRFESGTLKPNFKETNLTDLVIQTVLMFEKKIESKQLEIEGLDSDRLVAEVDADLIQQVIYNLVENAVKFVNANGTISFSFEKNKDTCIVGIKNTGEGLKNNEIQQVFDRFYKTDSSRGKDTTGLGLGLSISRKIIQLHDGHIIVRSVYGEYTQFSIEIPEKQKSIERIS